MPNKRIFLTGASGCIGHYIADALIQETGHDLYLLVRNPQKLQFDYESRPGVTIIKGDMLEIKNFADLLATIDVAILAATSWGGQQESFDINVIKTTQLVKLLNPEVCQQVIYFSTASIIDNNNKIFSQAGHFGTDYIRSKYDCYRQLEKLTKAPPITTVYPTLVFGGEEDKPYSHISAGLPDILKWIDLVRFFKADGSFHFIHGRDIATVIRHLVDNPPPLPEKQKSAITNHYVLGNQRITLNQAVEEICDYLGKKIQFRIPLSLGLAEVIINLLRTFGVKIEISSWDWFCMRYRHFTYQDPISPATFGLPTYCPTIRDLFKLRGIPQGRPATGVKSPQRARLLDDEPSVIPPENQLPADTQASSLRNFSTILDEPATLPPDRETSSAPAEPETPNFSDLQAFPEYLTKPEISTPSSEIEPLEASPIAEEVPTVEEASRVSSETEPLEGSTIAEETLEGSQCDRDASTSVGEIDTLKDDSETSHSLSLESPVSTIAVEPAEVSLFPNIVEVASTLPAHNAAPPVTDETDSLTSKSTPEEGSLPIEDLDPNSADIPIEDKRLE